MVLKRLKERQLSKVFNPNIINENRVFDKLSLEIKKGDFISIIGSNGAGKSILLNMISGTLKADSGSILLDGDEVINKSEYIRSKSIGRVFQDPSKGVVPNIDNKERLLVLDSE